MSEATRILTLGGLGARASTRGQRRRVLDGAPDPRPLSSWPGDWLALLRRWLRSPAPSRRIDGLKRGLDGPAVATVEALLDALLLAGWIERIEIHQGGGHWSTRELRWREADSLREALGLGRLDDREARLRDIAGWRSGQAALDQLHGALLALPPSQQLQRFDLLDALAGWIAQGSRGTRRDFELHARGATKSLGNGEWDWLERQLDLAALGIGRHAFGLWLRAGFRLRLANGELDLSAVTQPLALTAETLRSVAALTPAPMVWKVIENRTGFERVAATADVCAEAVLWSPGQPSGDWLDAVGHLLDLAPAPLLVACDPDPAGIAIASRIATPWQARGLDWQPWRMAPVDLDALPASQPLSEFDRALLDRLLTGPLHPGLHALALHLRERGCKGEQEGAL